MPQTDKKKRAAYSDFTVFIFPIIFTLACVVLYKIFQPTYNAFAASALAYGIKVCYTVLTLTNSFLCLFISVKLLKKRLVSHSIIYLVFFIALFFLFLELIHYGQKIYSPQTSPTPLALHELFQIRPLFDAAFFFLGLYSSFYWIRFIKTPQTIKSSTACLFVPNFSLLFYFFPIVIFFIIVNYLEYITHLVSNKNFTALIESHFWLFKLNRFFPHYSRLLLSIGLFIFFLRALIWINTTDTLPDKKLKYNFKEFLVLFFSLVFIMFGFLICDKHFLALADLNWSLADLGWGKYFEINDDLNGAIHHYNECVKKNGDEHAHKALFRLYHRLGKDDLAIQHLSQAIKKCMASGNQEMTTELYKTALSFYPNSTIDPETRVIYFQK